jgi:hypothetical protein
MFWSKTGREARRQRVLDELIEIDPVDRPSRLQEAVTAGDVRATEVEQALRLVDRLDALRVMSIPHMDGGLRGAAHGTDTESVVGATESQFVAADFASVPAQPQSAAAEAPIAVAGALSDAADASSVSVEVQSVAAEVESGPADADVRADAVSAGRIVRSHERRLVARKGAKAKSAGKALGRAQKSAAVPIVREPTAVAIEPEMLPTIDPRILAVPMPIDALESAARLIARDFGKSTAQRQSASPQPRMQMPRSDVAVGVEPSLAGPGRRQAEPAEPSIDWLRP